MPQVVYDLTLKDHFTSRMHEAKESAESLEGTMTSLFTTMGIGFGVYELTEYFSKAREEFEKIEQGTAQLQAGLESTGHAAGLAMEDLTEQSEHFSHIFKFSKGEVMEMQQVLLTFPGITKATFGDASQAVLDMSAKLHRSTEDIAIMIGKALQDPQTGIMAMRRVGVNFSHEQSKQVEQMVKDGHKLEAQAYILHELQNEFAGSAAANAAADPLFAYNKAMEETREEVGALIVEIQKELAPTLLTLAHHFKDLVEWISKNGSLIWELVKGLGIAYGVFKIGSIVVAGYTAYMEGLAGAEVAATTATEGFAAASTAALGPIGLIAGAIAGLVLVYQNLAGAVEKAEDAQKEFSQQGADAEKRELEKWQDFYEKHGYNEKDARYNAANREKQRLASEISALQEHFDKTKENYKKGHIIGDPGDILYKTGVALSVRKSQMQSVDEFLNAPKKVASNTPAGTGAPGTKSQTAGAKGNKNETINIHIDNLIKGFAINTTNMKESAGKVQEMITQALLNAVNNSQIIADH